MHHRVSRLLAAGMTLSIAALAAGAAAAWIKGLPLPVDSCASLQALRGSLGGEPRALMSLGILVLIATPILRVALLAREFARRGDWRYAGISCAVLAVLALSVALGAGR